MAIPANTTGKVQYTGDGSTKTFPLNFPIFKTTAGVYAIRVSLADRSGENVSVLMENTDYTVSESGNSFCDVVLNTAPESGKVLTIIYNNELSQLYAPTDFTNLPAASLINAFDKLTAICIQMSEELERCIKETVESTIDPNVTIQKVNELYLKLSVLEAIEQKLTQINRLYESIDDIDVAASYTEQIYAVSEKIQEVITAAENIGSIVTAAQDINAIKDAPNQANSARNSAIAAQNSAVTAQLMAAQAGESVSAAAASASAADASAAASAGSAQTAQDYAWQVVRRNIGDIFYTSRMDTELNGAVECNGAQYNIADFTGPQAVPALLSAGKLPYVSITDFDACVTANGSCRCFGWDGADATVFKVPKLNDVFMMAGTAASVGEFIGESLPNIIGSTGFSLVVPISGTASGALKKSTVSSVGVSSGGNNYGSGVLNLDASDSSSVYQNGAKVRPDSIRYRAFVQIATGAIDEALETCTGVLADVAGLKDAGNFTAIGKSVLSGLGMPSGRYIDLTLGASGSSYTAPANGYFFASGNWDSSGSFFHVTMDTGVYGVQASTGNSGPTHFRVLCPVAKGSDMVMGYTLATITVFRFVYAEGDDNV